MPYLLSDEAVDKLKRLFGGVPDALGEAPVPVHREYPLVICTPIDDEIDEDGLQNGILLSFDPFLLQFAEIPTGLVKILHVDAL